MSYLLHMLFMTCLLFETVLCQIHGLPSGDFCVEFENNPDSDFVKECLQNLDECQKGIQLIQKGKRCDPKCAEHGKCVLVHGDLKCNCTKGYYGKSCSFSFFDKEINITSTNYPNNYLNDMINEWIFQPITTEYPITIEFNDFNTEHCCDLLKIRENGQTERRFSGNLKSPFNVSGHGNIIISFQTDISVTETGFHATVYNGEQAYIFDEGMNITSPNFPNDYPNNSISEWILNPINPESPITIQFNKFDTQLYNDYVVIRENGQIYGFFFGNLKSPFNVSGHGRIFIIFRTDNSVTETGFHATVYNGELEEADFGI